MWDTMVHIAEVAVLVAYENIAFLLSLGLGSALIYILYKTNLFGLVINGIKKLKSTKKFEANPMLNTIFDWLIDLDNQYGDQIEDMDNRLDTAIENLTATLKTNFAENKIAVSDDEILETVAKAKSVAEKLNANTKTLSVDEVTALVGWDKAKINSELKRRGIDKTV